ncbi:MAG: calcium-binding protein, partial [Patescibacteria group bacterium]
LTSNILTTDKIYGTSAADSSLLGTTGNDTLLGGYGTDRVEGGAGDDTYIYKTGDGIDTISDVSGTDKLVFKDINESAATLNVAGNNIEISVDGTNKVVIENYATGNKIESVEFANGKIWNSSILAGNANVITGTVSGATLDGLNVKDIITGTSGNEIINGNGGDDTINGGSGDDTMYGGAGNDTYTFTEWSANDVVSDVSGATDLVDISKLTGTIEYQKSGTDLKIVETSGKRNITLKGYFDTATAIEGIKISATETLKLADIESKLVVTKPKQYFVFDGRNISGVTSTMSMELMGTMNSWSGGTAWKMDQVAEKVWVIATAKIIDSRTAKITLVNNYGSEDLTCTLKLNNDNTYTLNKEEGSTLKFPVRGKWQKIPGNLTLHK